MVYRGHDTVFSGGIYELCRHVVNGLPINSIVDLGARHGEGYAALGCYYPDASYVFVEPFSECFDKIEDVISNFPKRNIQHVAAILGEEEGTRELIVFETDDDQSSNLFSDRDGRYGKSEKIDVKVVPYAHVLGSPVDFAKINIEGAEYELIERPEFNNIQSFVMEVHNGLYPGKGFPDVIEALKDRYDLTSYGNTGYKYCFVSGQRRL